MANQELIDKLARKLQDGFTHPGDPERDIPPTPILLPFKPRAGMPQEMNDLLSGTAKLLAECIEAAILEDNDIIPKDQARAMRKAMGDGPTGPQAVPLSCRHCQNVLMVLSVDDPERIVIDGPAVLSGLHAKPVACPHEAG